jgi:hypothetical protein
LEEGRAQGRKEGDRLLLLLIIPMGYRLGESEGIHWLFRTMMMMIDGDNGGG